MFGREIRKREEREFAMKLPKILFFYFLFFLFLQNEWSGGIYTEKVALRLLVHLVGLSATLLTLVVSAFSQFNFGRVFKGIFGLRLS